MLYIVQALRMAGSLILLVPTLGIMKEFFSYIKEGVKNDNSR